MKQIRNKMLLAMAAAALLVAGCTKSDGEVPANPQSDGAIAPTATVRTITKAAVEGDAFPVSTANVFRLTAYRGAAAPTNWSTPYFSDVAVNSGAAGALTCATPHYYPAGEDKLYFYAYAPEATSLTAGNGGAQPIANYTIDGQQDIMAANEVTGIAKTVGGAQVQPAFAFTHCLTQVRFKVVADLSYWESGKTKKVTEIEIKNLRTSAKLSLDDGSLTFEGNYDHSLKLPITAGTKDEIAAGTEMNGSVMFEPIGTSGIIYLKVTADGVVYDDIAVTLTGSGAGEAGTSHLVTLLFKSTTIATTASIAPWSDGGQTEAQPQFAPAKMFYGDAANNGGVTTDLQGSTTSSYNSYTVGSNGPGYRSAEDAYAGEKGYYKLEVALANELNPDDGTESFQWKSSMNVCKDKTTDGGGWRLPRLSELVLMYLNRSSLEARPGFTAFTDELYWSSTQEDSEDYVCYVLFTNGLTNMNDMESYACVRCVRELPTPPAKMYYGGTNGGVTTSLKGSTTSSYNSYTASSNGSRYLTAEAAYAGEKGYYKLEVAAANELNPADGKETMTLGIAMNVCKAKTTDGGGWRLPRLSELRLILLNKSSLEATPGFTAFSASGIFWSGTEHNNGSDAWCVRSSDGTPVFAGKSNGHPVRCVREL